MLMRRLKALLVLSCILAPIHAQKGVHPHPKIDLERHVQVAPMSSVVFEENMSTMCHNVRTDIFTTDIFPPPPGMQFKDNRLLQVVFENRLDKSEFDKRRDTVVTKLKDYIRGQCRHFAEDRDHASNGNVTIREKRAVALVLGLAGLGAAFVSLAWVSLQQVDISRHNAQLKAAVDMNKNHRESAEISAEMLDIMRREHQLLEIDRYLDTLYSEWQSAIGELSSGYRFDSIRSEILKDAIRNHTVSVFSQRSGKYNRILGDLTTVTPLNCTTDHEINFRLCLQYAKTNDDAEFMKVMDYGRFVHGRSMFARIDINRHWIREKNGSWFAVTLVQCRPQGKKLWSCPKRAITLQEQCTPSDINDCPIDVYPVDANFLELIDWQGGKIIATNLKNYTVRAPNGQVSVQKVPMAGVFYLQIPEKHTVKIGNALLTGNSPVLRIHAHPVPTTLVEIDGKLVTEQLMKLEKKAIDLVLKIDRDGRAYATAAGISTGFFGPVLAFFSDFEEYLMIIPALMFLIGVFFLLAYCGCTPRDVFCFICRHCCDEDDNNSEHGSYRPAQITVRHVGSDLQKADETTISLAGVAR